jgi:hypothetical protein
MLMLKQIGSLRASFHHLENPGSNAFGWFIRNWLSPSTRRFGYPTIGPEGPLGTPKALIGLRELRSPGSLPWHRRAVDRNRPVPAANPHAAGWHVTFFFINPNSFVGGSDTYTEPSGAVRCFNHLDQPVSGLLFLIENRSAANLSPREPLSH